jgi:hypothetical protein
MRVISKRQSVQNLCGDIVEGRHVEEVNDSGAALQVIDEGGELEVDKRRFVFSIRG